MFAVIFSATIIALCWYSSIEADRMVAKVIIKTPYEHLRDPEIVKRVDEEHFLKFVQNMRERGYTVEVRHAPKGLPRWPYFVRSGAEKDIAPALSIISHDTETTGSLEETLEKHAFSLRAGSRAFFNTTFWIDRADAGKKPRIMILDGFLRTNHIDMGNRHAGAPAVYNWNTLGVEILAANEGAVMEEQLIAIADIALVYSEVIGRKVAVYAHSEINSNKTPGEGMRGRDAARKALQKK